MDIQTLAEIANLSMPAILILIIWLGIKRVWVWGYHYKELQDELLRRESEAAVRLDSMRHERDEFKAMLFRALKAAEAAVGRQDADG